MWSSSARAWPVQPPPCCWRAEVCALRLSTVLDRVPIRCRRTRSCAAASCSSTAGACWTACAPPGRRPYIAPRLPMRMPSCQSTSSPRTAWTACTRRAARCSIRFWSMPRTPRASRSTSVTPSAACFAHRTAARWESLALEWTDVRSSIHARFVVGADGLRSTIARLVDAPIERAGPARQRRQLRLLDRCRRQRLRMGLRARCLGRRDAHQRRPDVRVCERDTRAHRTRGSARH